MLRIYLKNSKLISEGERGEGGDENNAASVCISFNKLEGGIWNLQEGAKEGQSLWLANSLPPPQRTARKTRGKFLGELVY